MKTRQIHFVVGMILLILCRLAWGRGCVVEGTMIATPHGPVAVEKLQQGDDVYAIVAGRKVAAKVYACHKRTTDEIITLQTGGHTLSLTPDHPVAVNNSGTYMAAGNLPPSSRLYSFDHDELQATTIQSIQHAQRNANVYNLLVWPGENYIANTILVHNKGCFLPDTPIELATCQSKPISDIHPGDQVKAFTPDGQVVSTTVRDVFTAQADFYLKVQTSQRTLNVTSEHPFFIGNGTFKTIESLRMGDSIMSLHNGALQSESIIGIERMDHPTTVYNLHTDEPNTFFAHGVAVHNKGGGGGCFPTGTQIQTPTGPRAIESLHVGDFVIGVDSNLMQVHTPVAAIHQMQDNIVTLHTSAGDLRTTAEHPLLLWNGTFAATETLAIGVSLTFLSDRMKPVTIQNITKAAATSTVYNLTVGDPHTFIADNFVVHNKGGGGFGGGHGGGFHSFGGGSYRSYGHGSSTRPSNEYDWAIPALIIGGTLIYILYHIGNQSGWTFSFSNFKRSDEELDFIIPRELFARKAEQTRALARSLAAKVPEFAPDIVNKSANETFTQLQHCWQAREYSPMQSLMTPELYSQHILQLSQMMDQHEINMIDNLVIESTNLIHIHFGQTPAEHHAVILFTARARDYYIDDRTREHLHGDKVASRFQEFWTFRLINHRWILSDIEQSRESDIHKQPNFVFDMTTQQLNEFYKREGIAHTVSILKLESTRLENELANLAKRGPAFTTNEILARARMLYAAVISARQTDDPSNIGAKGLDSELIYMLREQCRQRQKSGCTTEYRNFTIRKAQIVSVKQSMFSSDPECTVRFICHAIQIRMRNGKIVTQDPYETTFEEYATLRFQNSQWNIISVADKAPQT